MTEHTPGPWTVARAKTGRLFVNGQRGFVCHIDQPESPEGTANARLIAAAPELLTACKHAAMSKHHPSCDHTHPKRCSCHVEKARAALAKATQPED